MIQGYYYFCHPYSAETKPEREANYKLCCIRSGALLLCGYNIFSPIVHSHSIEVVTPKMLVKSYKELWKFWIDLDIAILEFVKFTGVILAPGWGASRGCRKEYDWFLSHKQPDGKPHEILLYKDIVKGD